MQPSSKIQLHLENILNKSYIAAKLVMILSEHMRLKGIYICILTKLATEQLENNTKVSFMKRESEKNKDE